MIVHVCIEFQVLSSCEKALQLKLTNSNAKYIIIIIVIIRETASYCGVCVCVRVL